MPITPDVATLINDLGGAMVNYEPVLDPTTDLDAGFDNNSRCMVAMMSHTAIRSWAKFTTAVTSGAMVLNAHDALWGNSIGVAPTLARFATGIFTLTYPTTVNDELGGAHTVNFRVGWGQARSATAGFDVQVIPTAANVLTVYVRDNTNTLLDSVGLVVDVMTL
jgi:hypothetical protein